MMRWTDEAGLECELRFQADHWDQLEELCQRARNGACRTPYPERRLVYLMHAGRVDEAMREAARIHERGKASGRGAAKPRRLAQRAGQ